MYHYEELDNLYIGKQGLSIFDVHGRYRLLIDTQKFSRPVELECCIENTRLSDYKSGVDSGERLALKTWEKDNFMLGIGTEDEIPHTSVEYLPNGIKIKLGIENESAEIIFGISWIYITDYEKECNYTWFASDPTDANISD